jgi:Ulp1 family protease
MTEQHALQQCASYTFSQQVKLKNIHSLPQQDNSDDCGLFALEFIIKAWLNHKSFLTAVTKGTLDIPTQLIKQRRMQYCNFISEMAAATCDEDAAKSI